MPPLAGHTWGRTVVATLHQPSSQIFATFDDLLVLAEGAIVYSGPALGLVPYFSKLGYVCPTYTNPADFLFMDVLHSSGKGKAGGLLQPGGVDVEAGQGAAEEDSTLVLAVGGKSSAQLADAAAQRAVSWTGCAGGPCGTCPDHVTQ
jgi:ABC-type multidrug transport system ATPase subunit